MILKKYILPVLALVLGTASLAAGPISMDPPASQIINVEGRNTISLDGWWKYVIDPQDNGIKGYRNTLVDEAASYFVDMDYDSD
jgi:beta-glucuronidase